jgi:outer membrane protein
MTDSRLCIAALLVTVTLAQSTDADGSGQPGTVQAAPPLLTLRQALDVALHNNRQIAISGLQVEQAKQRVAQSRTHLLPQLSIDAAGGELLDRVKVHFPSGNLGTVNGSPVPSHDIDVTTKDRFSTAYNVTLAQPLTQIPRIQTGIRLQQVGTQIAHEQDRQQRQTSTLQVREVYFAILQTRDGIDAAEQGLKALNELERTVTESVTQQSALPADLLEVKARVTAQESALSTLRDTRQQFSEQMNVLLGRDLQTPFEVSAESEEPLPLAERARLQARALSDRPDLIRSALQVRQAELDRRTTQLGYIPDLSITVSYTGLGTGINGLPDHILTAGFMLTWKDPFDWGRRQHEISEKSKAIQAARLAHSEEEAAAQVDINNQIRRERRADDELKAAQAAQTAARERLRVTLNQYRANAALVKDALQAQAGLAEADRQVQDAGLARLIAQSELRRALGTE